ncbi:ribonucleases P/MRP protein subunit Pop1p [[Candida] jaroonii]|uniref:Ribonucleases P/MRP protein subunit Pop1p n=1 Tax=[Candida] jaroonii TaxID=467808 RepID=A0ACA9YBA5_9ASCO|nr:ribonucleases P/MRP protein subunit Pop1p [[Candida] jaroonii]
MDKKSKIFHTRAIRTQNTNYTNGQLSIPDFLKSRAFEIESFEQSQLRTKTASSTRVFQSLPRSMRRRTASHNVKRIPKRLRNRALREMSDTNVTKKKKINGRDRYKLKMRKKLMKLAIRIRLQKHIPELTNETIKTKLKALNLQLKEIDHKKSKPQLNNLMGSYDISSVNEFSSRPMGKKYHKRQQMFVWLNTHVWHAKRFHMIKRYGYQYPLSPTMKCYRPMNRCMRNHCVAIDTSWYDCLTFDFNESVVKSIMKVTNGVLKGEKSNFGLIYKDTQDPTSVIGEGLMFCSNGKVLVRVHPSIYGILFNHLKNLVEVEDCRYALGSIELIGPQSLYNLNRILRSDSPELQNFVYNDSLRDGTTLSFTIKDPRLSKLIKPRSNIDYNDLVISMSKPQHSQLALDGLLTSSGRTESYKDQLTTKLINRVAENPISPADIPVLLTKAQGKWILMCPWFWVLPIFHSLKKIPTLKFGGESQLEQYCFERNIPRYPRDFPFLSSGWEENQLEIKLGLLKYDKLPKSKQHHFDHEHGLIPFGPDWEFLYYSRKYKNDDLSSEKTMGEFNGVQRVIKNELELIEYINESRTNELCVSIHPEPKKLHIKPITLAVNGKCKPGARIYQGSVNLFNLVGFVTSGGNNLLEGSGTGIGFICQDEGVDHANLIIRNMGSSNTFPVQRVVAKA